MKISNLTTRPVLVLIIGITAVNSIANRILVPLMLKQAALRQMEHTDDSFVAYQFTLRLANFYDAVTLMLVVTAAILIAISASISYREKLIRHSDHPD